MGLWSWAKRVVREQGELDPIPIHLEKQPDGYTLRLGVRAGFGGQDTARIPIHVRPNPATHPVLKEIHYCEVAGTTLEAANMFALREKVGRLLETIAPARTLPLAYFRVPAMGYEVPAYEQDGRIVSPVMLGQTLKARDMAGIRRAVCRWLESAGYVSSPDQVEVGVVRPRDLSQVAPAAIYRSASDPATWMPSVEGTSPEGPVVGLLAHPAELRRDGRRRAGPAVQDRAPAAEDVVGLLRYLRAELSRRRARFDPESLYASQVRPEMWVAAEARLEPSGGRLLVHLADDDGTQLELPIFHTGAGEAVAAVEDDGINVFLERDDDALARAIGRYLAGHGFVRFETEVEIHGPVAPRAERLEPESIWTFDTQEVAAWR